MNVTLSEIGDLMLNDRFLCPKVPRDDLGAEGESIREMVDILSEHHGTVQVEEPTYGGLYSAIYCVLETSRFCFSVQEQAALDRGLKAFYPVAIKYPGRAVGQPSLVA